VVKEKERFFPRKGNEEIYKKAYRKYLEVYEKCFAKKVNTNFLKKKR
jgi:hypothetical protein